MSIRLIHKQLGTSAPQSNTGFLLYGGPCELLGMAIDFHGSADAGTVVTLRDGSSSGLTKFTATGNTDIGTTVPVRVFHDGRLIAGTATAGVGLNPSFFDGIYGTVASDVTGPQVIRLWVRPLIKKSVGIATTGVAGSAAGGAQIFQGPGRLKGLRVDYNVLMPTTTDVQIVDGVVNAAGTASGRNLTIVSNSATDWAAVNQQLVTTTGIDEAGSAVTTGATGAYANDGVLFYTGIAATVAGADSSGMAVQIDALIEGN